MTKIEALFKIKIKEYYTKINSAFKEVNKDPAETYNITENDIIKAERDFNWVIKVIDSCKTYQQFDSALSVVFLFRRKYPFSIVIERILERKILNKKQELFIS